jgi:hypothetical protein
LSKRAENLESYLLDVIRNRRRDKGAAVLRFVLRQISRLFAVIVQLRIRLFSWGILRPHTLGCQVLSVGNLTVGGTPVAAAARTAGGDFESRLQAEEGAVVEAVEGESDV